MEHGLAWSTGPSWLAANLPHSCLNCSIAQKRCGKSASGRVRERRTVGLQSRFLHRPPALCPGCCSGMPSC